MTAWLRRLWADHADTFLRFGLVGLSNTLLSYVVFRVLLVTIATPFWAQFFGYAAGIVWSFFLNGKWAFGQDKLSGATFTKFLSVQFVLLIVSSVSVSLAIETFAVQPDLAWVGVMAVITLINYLAMRNWVFVSDDDRPRVSEAGAQVLSRETGIAFLFSVMAGFAYGLCSGTDCGNHETYLPLAIRTIDPGFLAFDWWAIETTHYHWAFSLLAGTLYRFSILDWGMAILNVLLVAVTLTVSFRLLRFLSVPHIWLVFVTLVAVFFLSEGFFSVAHTYLLDYGLQASSFAAAASVLALYLFVVRQNLAAGFALSLAGIFHANYLLLNIVFFGLTYGLIRPVEARRLGWKELFEIRQGAALLGPSLVVFLFTLPLIFDVQFQEVSEDIQERARFAFFDFAGELHYVPDYFLRSFVSLAAWQALGLAWTYRATDQRQLRLYLFALQIAFLVVLWIPTALTTLVFVDSISRLFFWRLAPHAVLLATILFLVGTVKAATSERAPLNFWEMAGSTVGIVLLASHAQNAFGILSLNGMALLAVVLVPLALAGIRQTPILAAWVPRQAYVGPWLRGLASIACVLVLTVALTAAWSDERRFTLIVAAERDRDHQRLYRWVRNNTPIEAQFAVPPNMAPFRLLAERAIITDSKSKPFAAPELAEWLQRHEDQSGLSYPESTNAVVEGYRLMDESRLSFLRSKYGIDFVVVEADSPLQPSDWPVVYENAAFRVMSFRRPVESPSDD